MQKEEVLDLLYSLRACSRLRIAMSRETARLAAMYVTDYGSPERDLSPVYTFLDSGLIPDAGKLQEVLDTEISLRHQDPKADVKMLFVLNAFKKWLTMSLQEV